jgi:hypothetical protein
LSRAVGTGEFYVSFVAQQVSLRDVFLCAEATIGLDLLGGKLETPAT